MSVQTYKSIPLSNRKTINMLVLFKCMNKAEIKAIWEEMTFLPKEVFFNLLDYVFKKPFDYLVLDTDNSQYSCTFNKIEVIGYNDASENKTRSKSKRILNSKYKKLKIKNKNVVNVHIHKVKSSPLDSKH